MNNNILNINLLIKYMSYKQKIRLSSIDKKYRNTFAHVDPGIEFFKEMYDTQNIGGLEYILTNFYTSFKSFLDTKYLVYRVIYDNKYKIFEWILSRPKPPKKMIKKFWLCSYGAKNSLIFSDEIKNICHKHGILTNS